MIDLRSDTVSKPTDAMRQAMAVAEVGDDVWGDDPTVKALETKTADILGKEDAVYVTSGTMANQVAIRVHALGDEILCEETSHVHLYEGGGGAALSGISIRTIPGKRGLFEPEDLDPVVRKAGGKVPQWIIPPTPLLCLENTHTFGGGTIWPLEQLQAVTDRARHHGMATHLDGARIWNAEAATGISAKDYADTCDTMAVCFSKGLGAPIGSCVVGPKDFIAKCRRVKHLYGGGFRQAGIVAAGALHGLEHHRERLVEDHANARRFAEALVGHNRISLELDSVETNLVYFYLHDISAADFCNACETKGVAIQPMGPNKIRAVFHLGVSSEDCDQAIKAALEALEGA